MATADLSHYENGEQHYEWFHKNEHTIISQSFYGQLKICSKCNGKFNAYQIFGEISLAVPKCTRTLRQLLVDDFQEEHLKACYDCKKCGPKQDARQ